MLSSLTNNIKGLLYCGGTVKIKAYQISLRAHFHCILNYHKTRINSLFKHDALSLEKRWIRSEVYYSWAIQHTIETRGQQLNGGSMELRSEWETIKIQHGDESLLA